MKAARLFWLSLLAIALLPGSASFAGVDDSTLLLMPKGDAQVLGSSRQVTELYLGDDGTTWYRILPDGTTQVVDVPQGSSFVMTRVFARFYATNPNTGPYRFYIKVNSTRMYIANLDDITYPETDDVYGGAINETITPGIVFSAQPTVEVKQLPVPPNDPNSGSVVPGTVYLHITGFFAP